MKKWEYLIITVFTHKSIVYFPDGSTHEYLDSVVALNTLGDEGWELVNDTQVDPLTSRISMRRTKR